MNRQYPAHDGILINLPGMLTQPSNHDLKYSQNAKIEAMLPPLDSLPALNRAPTAELMFRTAVNPEQNEHLPSISELVPELPAYSSRSFSPRSCSDSEHKIRVTKTYSNFGSPFRSTPSPQSEFKRRRLSNDGDEDQMPPDERNSKIYESNSQTGQRNRFRQNGPFVSDLLLSPQISSSSITINALNKSPKTRSLTTSAIKPSRYSPTPYQNAHRSTSEPQQFSGLVSPQRSEKSSRSTSEPQNCYDREFQGKEWFNILDFKKKALKISNDTRPLRDSRTQKGFHLGLSSQVLTTSSNSLCPRFTENEYSFEPLNTSNDRKNHCPSKLSFHSETSNVPLFCPRTEDEQRGYKPNLAPTNSSFQSSQIKLQTRSSAYPTHNLQSQKSNQDSAQENFLFTSNTSHGIYSVSNDRHINDSNFSSGSENKPRKRRGNLPKETTDILRAWFVSHLAHPYPTEDEKQQLMDETGLQMNQISNWYINARRRQLPTMAANARAEAEARKLSQCNSKSQSIGRAEETIKHYERFDACYLNNGDIKRPKV